MTSLVILGSTGSIGTQAIAVLAAHPGQFQVTGIAASGAHIELLAQQVKHLQVTQVAVADSKCVPKLKAALGQYARCVEILAGEHAASELAGSGAEVVLNGISGSIGLAPTLAALAAGSRLALANKESLVVGGPLVKKLAAPGQIVPVDSEHSAIAQCLLAGSRPEVRRLILTASGGPFRGRTRAQLASVTVAEALAHPTWQMGPVVTINSATLINKALELIEAHVLFAIPVSDIVVVVHPQSLVHSLVEFCDGSTIAQVSPPDMRLPIALGLTWPSRLPQVAAPMDWTQAGTWHFEPLDDSAFPAVQLARAAVASSATHPAVFNAANEEAVAAFRAGTIRFTTIVDLVESVLGDWEDPHDALTLEGVLAAEAWARSSARQKVSKWSQQS